MSKPDNQALQAIDTETAEGATIGRPPIYNAITAEFILDKLSGGETLTSICKAPGLPSRQTVLRWRRRYPDFGRDYLLAREDMADCYGDECIEISDDSSLDTVTKTDRRGNEYEAVDHENIQRSKLMVETRRFLMATMNSRYSPKMQHDHSGEVAHVVVDLSDRERMRRLASFMLDDQRNGVTIEQTAEPATGVTMSDSVNCNDPQPAASLSPSDIVAGKNRPSDQE